MDDLILQSEKELKKINESRMSQALKEKKRIDE